MIGFCEDMPSGEPTVPMREKTAISLKASFVIKVTLDKDAVIRLGR